jgi:hypothetical protein
MTREDHLEWAKARALEYLTKGDLASAIASMGSDLAKHDETRQLAGAQSLMMVGILYATRGDNAGVKRWIEGFR